LGEVERAEQRRVLPSPGQPTERGERPHSSAVQGFRGSKVPRLVPWPCFPGKTHRPQVRRTNPQVARESQMLFFLASRRREMGRRARGRPAGPRAGSGTRSSIEGPPGVSEGKTLHRAAAKGAGGVW
jgi:hypothetical protein